MNLLLGSSRPDRRSLSLFSSCTYWNTLLNLLVLLASMVTLTSLAAAQNILGQLPEITIAANLAMADSDQKRPGPPAVSFDGSNYLVITCRSSGSPSGIIAVILSNSGAVIRSFEVALHTCQSAVPAVAFDGANYLVAFYKDGQIFGVRINSAGTVLDSQPFSISKSVSILDSNFAPAVAFDGNNYLVVWQKYDPTNVCSDGLCRHVNAQEIYGAMVTPAGLVSNEFPIFKAPGGQIPPSVAFDGINYMVVWTDSRDGSPITSNANISAARVSPAGVVLDPDGLEISTAPGIQEKPKIAFDGTNYLIVWVDGRDDPLSSQPNMGIFAARVSPDGTLLDGPPDTGGIAIAPHPTEDRVARKNISVTFNEEAFLVSWSIEAPASLPPAGIFLAKIANTGKVGSAEVLVAQPSFGSSELCHPEIISGDNAALIVWVNNTEKFGTTKSVVGKIIPPNRQPLADGGPDQMVVTEGTMVALNGSGSSDPDGDGLIFSWTQVGGPTVALNSAETANPTFVMPQLGFDEISFTFQLVVSDGILDSLPDTVTITFRNAVHMACAIGADINALITDPVTPAKGLVSLRKALVNVTNGCDSLTAGNFLPAFTSLGAAVANLESALRNGASTSAIILTLRNLLQSSASAKIDEAESKVCASEKHVQAARSSYTKGLATASGRQAVRLFRTAVQNAIRGINTQVNISGNWMGILKVAAVGRSAKLEFRANLVQTNTAISGTFGDSITTVGTIAGTICGVSLNGFYLSFGYGSTSGTGKTNATGTALTVRLSGTNSGIPFKMSGTIRKQERPGIEICEPIGRTSSRADCGILVLGNGELLRSVLGL